VRALTVVMLLALAVPASAQYPASSRESWVALAQTGFVVPEGRTAIDLLIEMNALLASDDPVLRDDVAFSAAERILRDRRVGPADLRRLLQLWTKNLDDGLGATGDDRVFKRSFSALCLSLIAAADLSAPFLEEAEPSQARPQHPTVIDRLSVPEYARSANETRFQF
jgi:hypothetical protein